MNWESVTSLRSLSVDSHPSERDTLSRLICADGKDRYDEIRNLYIEQLAYVWMDDSTTEATRASVDMKIDSFVKGDLEHAAEAVSALLEIANKTGDIMAPSNTSPAVSPFQFLLPSIIRECLLRIIRLLRSQAPATGRL